MIFWYNCTSVLNPTFFQVTVVINPVTQAMQLEKPTAEGRLQHPIKQLATYHSMISIQILF